MEITDKNLVLQMLNRFGVSPEKIQRITDILDGRFDSSPAVVSYERAAEYMGLTARNRAKTISLWVRTGKLEAVYLPGGKKSLGVSIESLRRLAESRNIVKN